MTTHIASNVAWSEGRMSLAHAGGPIAVCTVEGRLVGATDLARAILESVGIPQSAQDGYLPGDLWRHVCATPVGEPNDWTPEQTDGNARLGFTRYHLGTEHCFLLMREVSAKHRALSRQMHQQRLGVIGRLVATIAHDLRAPIASIVFNADRLAKHAPVSEREVASDIRAAVTRLRETVDGLLDFARLGPPVTTDVELGHVLDRVSGLLRPSLRNGRHVLEVGDAARGFVVRVNPLVIEQILVNLVMNAAEAGGRPVHIRVGASPHAKDPSLLAVSVQDDGPGVSPELRARVFDPFFTTKPSGTGLGLTVAREAARELGGDLTLEETAQGAQFVVLLPRAPRGEGS